MPTDRNEYTKLYFLRNLVDVIFINDWDHLQRIKIHIINTFNSHELTCEEYTRMKIGIKIDDLSEYFNNKKKYKNYKKILYTSNFGYNKWNCKYISIGNYKNLKLNILGIVAFIELIDYFYDANHDINFYGKIYYKTRQDNINMLKTYLEDKIREIEKDKTEEIEDLKKRVNKLEKLLNNMLCYAPDAPGYDKAKEEFDELK